MDILTPRLFLKPLSADDLDDLAALYADPEVMRGSSGVAAPRDRAESAAWLTGTLSVPNEAAWVTFRVEGRGTGAFLGRCGLRPVQTGDDTELAYAFARRAWGRGIATEAAEAVVTHGFDAGLTRLVACALASNPASQPVLEKVGMRRVREETLLIGTLTHYAMDGPATTPSETTRIVAASRHRISGPRIGRWRTFEPIAPWRCSSAAWSRPWGDW
jgi:ribosomal-protein-alanine N-acetyltransferase